MLRGPKVGAAFPWMAQQSFILNPDLHMDVSLSHFNLFLDSITELPADHLECTTK